MPASVDGFDMPVSWVQVSCQPGNKFCTVNPNIFNIIIAGLLQNIDQFTRTEQSVPDSTEVQGSRQNGCSIRISMMSLSWH
jgi:hypothetical protein